MLASALYFPAKVVLAAGGAVASGVTYVATLGSPEPKRAVWDATTLTSSGPGSEGPVRTHPDP